MQTRSTGREADRAQEPSISYVIAATTDQKFISLFYPVMEIITRGSSFEWGRCLHKSAISNVVD